MYFDLQTMLKANNNTITFIQLILLFAFCDSYSQDTANFEIKQTSIRQDIRIQQLVEKRAEIEEKKEGMPGFRVQVFFGSSKQTALQTKTDFSELFKNIDTYVIYDIPYFKVRAGNFRTHLEAQKLLALVKTNYPSAFIVKDQIVIPELIEDSDN